MSIKHRILLGPIVAIVLFAIFGAVAYHALTAQATAMQQIKETRFEQYRAATEMMDRLSGAHVKLFGLVTWFAAYDAATQTRLVGEVPALLSALGEDFARWQADGRNTAPEQAKLDELAGLLAKYRKETDGALEMTQIDVTSALGNMRSVASEYAALSKAFQELNEIERQLADQAYGEARGEARTAVAVNAVVLALAIAIAAGIGFATAHRLLRQLGGEPAVAVEVANRIADGDLSIAVPAAAEGSLIHAMGRMRRELNGTIARMADSARALSTASEQVAQASHQVAQRSSQQNDAAASTASAIEQMSASIGNVSHSAREASSLSAHSGATAQQGAGIVLSAADEMRNIAASVNAVSDAIRTLGEHASGISGVVTVISEVAGQTNLLALNAAIEAARAGEQGRGFAVVADEVRKLAERTTSSTSEISAMVSAIQASASEAVSSMDAAAGRVAKGVDLAGQAGAAIDRIREEAARVLAAIREISDSLGEQGTVTHDIAAHVEQIARMSDENNTVAADSAAAASQLESLSRAMNQDVNRFRLS